MTHSNVKLFLQVATNYLTSLGLQQSQIENLLSISNFQNIFVMKLAPVNVLKANRPRTSNSKQTHIHITGAGREGFYSLDQLNNTHYSTDDTNINVILIQNNLDDLHNKRNEETSLQLINSTTVKKISIRTNQESQVQISKLRYDGADFLNLRRGLYVGDYLMFLRYKNSDDTYLVLGIPRAYSELYTANYSIDLPKSVEMDYVQKSAGKFYLNFVDPQNINDYTFNDVETEDHKYDLSNAIQQRGERTSEHQKIWKYIATTLAQKQFEIYNGNIDCLAYKDDQAIIFEIKTLSGTVQDEVKQVRAALAQLLYYDFFATQQFSNKTKKRIAFFSSKISDEHIKFLQLHECFVLWLENEEMTGTTEAMTLVK